MIELREQDLEDMESVKLRDLADRIGTGYRGLTDIQLRSKIYREAL